jgi:hypothetical protein
MLDRMVYRTQRDEWLFCFQIEFAVALKLEFNNMQDIDGT